ncbi:MAG: hypothetical protein KY468_17220 [Armatimonadetes bacterium]|nr:hypothetical protein [Armatimonadota bacterium]
MWMKVLFAMACLMAVLSVAGTARNLEQRRHLRAVIENTEQKISDERLIGENPDRVISFLDREGISHGGYEVKSESGPENNDRTVRAKIPDVAQTVSLIEGPFIYDVLLRFQFDGQNRLIGYTVGESAVGF